jgi:hypothetical protein
MIPILKSISLHMKYHFKNLLDEIGINISALKMIQKDVSDTIDGNKQSEGAFGLDFSRPEGGSAFEF